MKQFNEEKFQFRHIVNKRMEEMRNRMKSLDESQILTTVEELPALESFENKENMESRNFNTEQDSKKTRKFDDINFKREKFFKNSLNRRSLQISYVNLELPSIRE